MKPMKTSWQRIASAVLVFLFTLGLAGSAGAWGNAPTHLSMANDLIQLYALPAGTDEQLFLCAAVAPDIGNSVLFKGTNRGYVHSWEFAECLLTVAGDDPKWRATALAWAVHMKVDDFGHRECIPQEDPLHAIMELQVDTIIFKEGSPFVENKPLDWEAINDKLGPTCCDPKLIFRASQYYRQNYDPAVPLVWPQLVRLALRNLKAALDSEYEYHKKFGNAWLSWKWLERHGLDGWPGCYEDSVYLAREWLVEQ